MYPWCHYNYSPNQPHSILYAPPHLAQRRADPWSGEAGWKTPLCHPSCSLLDWPHCGALCAGDRGAGRMQQQMDAAYRAIQGHSAASSNQIATFIQINLLISLVFLLFF